MTLVLVWQRGAEMPHDLVRGGLWKSIESNPCWRNLDKWSKLCVLWLVHCAPVRDVFFLRSEINGDAEGTL